MEVETMMLLIVSMMKIVSHKAPDQVVEMTMTVKEVEMIMMIFMMLGLMFLLGLHGLQDEPRQEKKISPLRRRKVHGLHQTSLLEVLIFIRHTT